MNRHLFFAAASLSLRCSGNSEEGIAAVHPSVPDASDSGNAPGAAGATGSVPDDVGSDARTGAAGSSGAGSDAADESPTGVASETGAPGTDGMWPPADTGHSVLERNKHPSRDGLFLQPELTKAKAATLIVDN